MSGCPSQLVWQCSCWGDNLPSHARKSQVKGYRAQPCGWWQSSQSCSWLPTVTRIRHVHFYTISWKWKELCSYCEHHTSSARSIRNAAHIMGVQTVPRCPYEGWFLVLLLPTDTLQLLLMVMAQYSWELLTISLCEYSKQKANLWTCILAMKTIYCASMIANSLCTLSIWICTLLYFAICNHTLNFS